MSFEDDIVNMLLSDNTGQGNIVSLATGGVYSYDFTGRLGLNEDTLPQAYNAVDGSLNPTIIVRERSEVPDGGILSSYNQLMSVRATMEVYCYADGAKGFSIPETMKKRVYVDLAEQYTQSNQNLVRYFNQLRRRDPAIRWAAFYKMDFVIFSMGG